MMQANQMTVERALKPDGSEVYTIELGATHAAALTVAAAAANMDPDRWLLRAIGERIADEAAAHGTKAPDIPPGLVN